MRLGGWKLGLLVRSLWMIVFFSGCVSGGTHNFDREFTPPSEMTLSDWFDPDEMEQSWEAGLVRIPDGNGAFIKGIMAELEGMDLPAGTKFPTVIYLHGCAGVWKGTRTRINFLARNGFAVIAPVSFAREKYPKSCDPKTYESGLYRGTLRIRQYDAGYAIKKSKTLQWVDPENVFLMGYSQGGVAAATFSSNNRAASVNARVIEAWTCHAGWMEYEGIYAPPSEPVLALVAEDDPWYEDSWTSGDCGRFLDPGNGSKSVVFRDEELRHRHALLEHADVQSLVLQFLNHYKQ
jgi:dienelactone hydrolase